MGTKLKHYIQSAFSDLLLSSTNVDKTSSANQIISKFDDLQTAKDKPRKGFNCDSDLAAMYEPNSMTHILDLFLWPCNAFAICASLLKSHGDYRLLISDENDTSWTMNDKDEVVRIGKLWGDILATDLNDLDSVDLGPINSLLINVFDYKNQNTDISDLKKDSEIKKHLLKVCLSADESFKKISVLNPLANNIAGRIAEQLSILNSAHGYQLAMTNNSFDSVHYKSSVCQSGISINSISNKLALISPEINLQYIERLSNELDKKRDNYNILILPWPLIVDRTDFETLSSSNLLEMESDFGFFTYAPSHQIKEDDLNEILDNYYLEFDEIDMITLPECAVESSIADLLFKKIESYCKSNSKYCPTFVTGVYKKPSDDEYGINSLKLFTKSESYINDSPLYDSVEQYKHHRWFLDRSQIHNYKLGNRLSPKRKWWEFSKVGERSLISYYCQKNDIQITPLICEDLARQDPVAPIIRSLGPNLIIALLLDGAQIKSRWPGRYASLLSEDPGSSVLTISPLGMTMRSDGTGYPPSNTVAFWTEPNGSYKELNLKKSSKGIVLTLEPSYETQWTADGRKMCKKVLNYAGHICI